MFLLFITWISLYKPDISSLCVFYNLLINQPRPGISFDYFSSIPLRKLDITIFNIYRSWDFVFSSESLVIVFLKKSTGLMNSTFIDGKLIIIYFLSNAYGICKK